MGSAVLDKQGPVLPLGFPPFPYRVFTLLAYSVQFSSSIPWPFAVFGQMASRFLDRSGEGGYRRLTTAWSLDAGATRQELW